MRWRPPLCAALAAALLVPSARAEGTLRSLRENAQAGVQVSLETAIDLDGGDAQRAELTLQPEFELELSADLRLVGIARLRADALDRIEPGARTQREAARLSRRANLGSRAELELRELYLEGPLGRARFTVGKQQIVWGTADGLKVLDVVNPQSFREFILDAFEDSRIPLWAVRMEIPVDELTLQLIWMPDPTVHELPESDSVFALSTPRFAPRPPPGVPVRVLETDRPRRALADSDIGARLSLFWRGFDLTLNALYHYHDVPIPFRTVGLGPEPTLVIAPRHERTLLVGGTLSYALGDWVVRGELGYETDRYFASGDPRDGDGVVHSAELAHVIGLDWWGLRNGLVSLQLFQSWLPSWEDGLARDEVDRSATLLLRRSFRNETLTAEVTWIQNLNDGDGLVRPRLRYEIRDGLELEASLDLFYGSSRGVFGQYDDRDRVALSVRWSR